MHETLREWADALRGIADEAEAMARQIDDGIFVSPDDIDRLTSGVMIANVTPLDVVPEHAPPVPMPVERVYATFYLSKAQREESYVVQGIVRSITDDLDKDRVVEVAYRDEDDAIVLVQRFEPGDIVSLDPWPKSPKS